MATKQPPAEVEVSHEQGYDAQRVDVTVRRDGSNRGEPKTYTGQGANTSEAVKDVVKRMLDDPVHGEFIRRG